MLTPKERLKMILEGRKADRPACICPGGMMNMVTSELQDKVKIYLPEAHEDARQMADLAKAVYEEGCFENYGVPFCMTVEAEEMGARIDMGTRVYEPHVTGYAIDSVSGYRRLRPISMVKGRAKVVLDAIRILKEETEDVPIVGNLTGPVSTASSLLEPVVFYKELRKKNREAHEYLEFITEQLIAFGRAQLEAGADVIAISDPSGTGEILGPKYFKEFAVTYINRLLGALQEEKLGTIVHICGQMSPVYEEVQEVRSSVLSFDSVVPMKEAREHLKDRILMGNVSTYALEFGDPDRVKTLAKNCMKSGLDIISPACGLGMKSPLRNVQAILEGITWPEITIEKSGRKIECQKGENLLEVLLDAGVFVDNPCSGKGNCGKCKIKVSAEGVSGITEPEEKFLTPEEIEAGIRLACMTEVTGKAKVELICKERKHEALTKGYIPEFRQDSFEDGYGAVVDIGTTTVVLALIDLKTGEEVAHASMINPQKRYGLDVLTRITYEYEHLDCAVQRLQEAIVNAMNGMLEETCREAAVSRKEIREIDVAANCTMTHMLLGVDARAIGRAPYRPKFTDARELPAADIGIDAAKGTRLYCLPQVSAYIGADIVAGAYVCGLQKEKGNVLFIDIGTNGEIVLANKGRLLCCSCAAGPALEGMNISSGMRAEEGAIEDVRITEQGIELTVIGGQEPAGLCGSGILAAVKELLRTGIVKKNGAFVKKEKLGKQDYRNSLIQMNGAKREFLLCENPKLLVTQGDVRQVQLAKGAILSGITALLRKAGIRMEELDKVMIAGQFGAHLPAESLIGTGILPRTAEGKLLYVGNSSKTGAYMALMSGKVKREVELLAKKMEYMELAETENYERIFAESMIFPG